MSVGDIQTQDTIIIQNTDRGKMRRSGKKCHTNRDLVKYMHGVTTLLEMNKAENTIRKRYASQVT